MSVPVTGVSLLWLLDGIATLPADEAAGRAVRVGDLTLDSRDVRAGSLFFALGGRRAHGMHFAAEAAGRGASVVLWDPEERPLPDANTSDAVRSANPSTFVAAVPGLKRMVGRIADRFFGWPSSQMRIVGITGTNGKTTSAYLLTQCLQRLKSDAAYIGTIGWGRIDALQPLAHTTPDVITVHRQLAKLRAHGRARRGDGGVLARPRSGPRGRRALSFGRIHEFDPRSPGLPPVHAGLW
jgi:UDP-N-acetylmuramoyl-L-alanyl-D-glutamate--2,6-diaminopimelate ligase